MKHVVLVSRGLCTALALACSDGATVIMIPRPGGAVSGDLPDPESAAALDDPMGATPAGSATTQTGTQGAAVASDPAAAAGGNASSPASNGGNSASGSSSVPDGSGAAPAAAGASNGAGGTGAGNTGQPAEPGGGGNASGPGKAGSGAEPGPGGAGGQGEAGQGGDAPGGGGGTSEPRPLPDLVLDGVYLMATVAQDFVDASADMCLFNEGCVTGSGLRRVIRFGTRSANVGPVDLVVGVPEADNPLWEFDACHEHFHFEGYASYDLVDAATGAVLPIGNKNGFCLQDLDTWSLPSGSCGTFDCEYQGISAGCADVYTPDLDCQWVDITDVAPGVYELVVTVNSENTVEEQTHDNNSVSVTVQILDETVRVLP